MNVELEINKRVEWIKNILKESHTKGIVFGNSGGKDCTLVGILCKMATDNVTSIIMPCESSRNYKIDRDHALLVTNQYKIDNIEVDLTPIKKEFRNQLNDFVNQENTMAYANINPRLRMTTLYAYAYDKNYLVAGTGNLSERTMGYFTKFGDGAFDFNPIGDLTATEIYEFLRYLKAPNVIIEKAPSAGLFEGQTDEKEMGLTYDALDKYIRTKQAPKEVAEKIDRTFKRTAHKRDELKVYPN